MKREMIVKSAEKLTSRERIDAFAWKASLAKSSYGRYVVNLSAQEREAVLEEYAQYLTEVKAREVERLREWALGRNKKPYPTGGRENGRKDNQTEDGLF